MRNLQISRNINRDVRPANDASIRIARAFRNFIVVDCRGRKIAGHEEIACAGYGRVGVECDVELRAVRARTCCHLRFGIVGIGIVAAGCGCGIWVVVDSFDTRAAICGVSVCHVLWVWIWGLLV